MPDTERVRQYIAMVAEGRYVDAIRAFYHPDATIQENLKPPRVGVENHIANEERAAANNRSIRTLPGTKWFVQGDDVAIHVVFEITGKDGAVKRLDEMSLQRWVGDRIAEERFFYDPAQLRNTRARP